MGLKEDFSKPYIITFGSSQSMNNPKILKIKSMVTAVLLRNKENSN